MAAEAALAEGRPAEACRLASQSLAIDPSDLRAQAIVGSCLLQQGDAPGAKQAFAQALEVDQGFHRARIGLAEAEAALGNRSEASRQIRLVLASSPPKEEAARLVKRLEELKPPAVSPGQS